MELADAHAHFFRQGFQTKYGVFFPEEREIALYEGIREVHQIGDILAIGYEGEPAYQGNNRYLAELSISRPWLHPLAYFDAGNPPTVETLAQFWQERFVGISLYLTDAPRAEAFIQWPMALIAALNEHRAVVSINIPCRHLPIISAFLEKLDGCRILISHLGLPSKHPEGDLEKELRPLTKLARLSNLGVKASAFYACGEAWYDYPHPGAHAILEILLEAFGFERLFWGSDFSPALEFVSIPQTIEVLLAYPNLGEIEREAIFGGNLRRLLNGRGITP